MGYRLQAIVGKQQTLARHESEFHHARVVPLTQDIALIPLTDDLFDEIADGEEVEYFWKLSPGVMEWARRMSAIGPVAYVEAEFFGGIGDQSAVGWSGGSLVFGPLHAPDAKKEALRFLGVRAAGGHDEFDTVGLGRHRNTADWFPEATR